MKYSVIIPVYNAARTLRRCLDSLVDQSFDDYELLLINDGSTDGSDAICREYANVYPCIRYFAKENGGISSARNLGLEQAKGEYILFVDSDDYVANNYFAVIGHELARYCPDLLMFGAANTGGEEQTRIAGAYREAEELNIARRIAEAMQRYLFSSLWNKGFKRETIERLCLHFEDGLSIGEDQLFIFAYAMHIKSLVSVEEILYFVDISDQGSLSRKARPYLTEQLMEVNSRMYAAYRTAEHSPEAARCYEAALSWVTYRSAYSSCKELLKFEYSAKQRRQEIRRICKLYRAEKVRPVGWKCRGIALPIQLSWAFMLDMLVRYKAG
jgi:glycosyltransferase involved in cell wall biosynthesis